MPQFQWLVGPSGGLTGTVAMETVATLPLVNVSTAIANVNGQNIIFMASRRLPDPDPIDENELYDTIEEATGDTSATGPDIISIDATTNRLLRDQGFTDHYHVFNNTACQYESLFWSPSRRKFYRSHQSSDN